nr:MAG TPA: hypothetical protein [Caudoviricetes sp.]
MFHWSLSLVFAPVPVSLRIMPLHSRDKSLYL